MRTTILCAAAALVLATAGCYVDDDQLDEAGDEDVDVDGPGALDTLDSLDAALTTAAPDCATAPERDLSIFWWRTVRRIDRFVWSSDGRQIYSIEQSWEEKKPLLPIGGLSTRRFCHKLFVQQPDASGRHIIGVQAGFKNAALYAMQPANYTVVESLDNSGNMLIHRWSADGTRKLLATTPDTCSYPQVVPSPEGARMASILVRTPCGSNGSPTAVATVNVRMLNAAGDPIAAASQVQLQGFVVPVWNRAGQLVVTDFTSAFSFGPDGQSPVAVARPTCTDPATTSSIVDAQGNQLDIVNGQIGIATHAPDRAWGCGQP